MILSSFKHFCFMLLLFTANVTATSLIGHVTSYVSIPIKKNHIGKEYIYIKQTDRPWVSVAEGKGMMQKYGVITGDLVAVNITKGRRARRRLHTATTKTTITILQEAQRSKEIYQGLPINITSVAYIISMNSCGLPAPISASGLQKIWFNNNTYPSIKGFFSTCTYNKMIFNENKNIILGPIEVPCKGNYTRGKLVFKYDASRACTSTEQYSWVTYAEDWARKNGYFDLYNWDKVAQRRIIMIIPSATKCAWAGLSPVGCYKSCATYIKGGYARDHGVVFHELGHTTGLMHASRGMDEYGDRSDVMGDDGKATHGYVCMAAPNMYRVGWSSPLANMAADQINDANTNTGTPMMWRLPPTSNSDSAYLRINASDTIYFISLRRKVSQGYDALLGNDLNNKVFIHIYNGDPVERNFNMSSLIKYMGVNGTWSSPTVRVDVKAITRDGALIRVCYMTAKNETGLDMCYNGVDDDCDGLIDDADPGCR